MQLESLPDLYQPPSHDSREGRDRNAISKGKYFREVFKIFFLAIFICDFVNLDLKSAKNLSQQRDFYCFERKFISIDL